MEKVWLMEEVYSLWPSISEDSIVAGKKDKAKNLDSYFKRLQKLCH